uniref:Cullin domain-containing protein n=1 Tax=Rhabditophanes sp. KR3021 TaxID=114890 RepID=A0AC35TT34_9BILA
MHSITSANINKDKILWTTRNGVYIYCISKSSSTQDSIGMKIRRTRDLQPSNHTDTTLPNPEYHPIWINFLLSSIVTHGICRYLNRHWINRKLEEGSYGVRRIINMLVTEYKIQLFNKFSSSLVTAVLQLINKERNNQSINSGLIHKTLQSYVCMGITLDTGAIPKVYQLLGFAAVMPPPLLPNTLSVPSVIMNRVNDVQTFLKQAKKATHQIPAVKFLFNLNSVLSEQPEIINFRYAQEMFSDMHSNFDDIPSQHFSQQMQIMTRTDFIGASIGGAGQDLLFESNFTIRNHSNATHTIDFLHDVIEMNPELITIIIIADLLSEYLNTNKGRDPKMKVFKEGFSKYVEKCAELYVQQFGCFLHANDKVDVRVYESLPNHDRIFSNVRQNIIQLFEPMDKEEDNANKTIDELLLRTSFVQAELIMSHDSRRIVVFRFPS